VRADFRVRGDDEAARALGRIGDGLDEALVDASDKVAEVVEHAAAGKARGLGGVAAKSAPALGTQRGSDAAAVVLDGNAYPFAPGAEFGSIAYPQFDAWRGQEDGYFLYPAIRETEDQNVQTFVDAVDDLINRAGF
jgi:hypothetical protein